MRAGIGDAGLARRRSSPRPRCRPAPANGVIRMTIEAIFISKASIFLPRYSGVRPIISPAMNTAMMAKISMPYRPEPTPPNTTSPSCIRHIGTRPPSGVNESCIAVDRAAGGRGRDGREQRRVGDAEARLLAFHIAAGLQRARGLVDAQLRDERIAAAARPGTRAAPAARTGSASRQHRPALARVADHAAEGVSTARPGSGRSRASRRKLVSGVGFSYGCAELALKKPPPLVPSILMASCEATGPIGKRLGVRGRRLGDRRCPPHP